MSQNSGDWPATTYEAFSQGIMPAQLVVDFPDDYIRSDLTRTEGKYRRAILLDEPDQIQQDEDSLELHFADTQMRRTIQEIVGTDNVIFSMHHLEDEDCSLIVLFVQLSKSIPRKTRLEIAEKLDDILACSKSSAVRRRLTHNIR